jgi:hypothetical protein
VIDVVLVLLLAILTFLALGLGDQPIVAYTATTDSRQAAASVTPDSDVTNDGGGTAGQLETLGADAGAPEQSTIQDK